MNNISDYIQNNNQQQRQNHIDLSSECMPYYLTKGGKTGRKAGDLAGNRMSMKKAKSNLLKFLNILDFKGYQIHTCHLCQNNSNSSNFVCINPLHTYFGTQSENEIDKDPEIRKEVTSKARKIGAKIGGKIGVKSQLENGTHISQTISICYYCNKSGNTINMKRWHFDNCKHKQNK